MQTPKPHHSMSSPPPLTPPSSVSKEMYLPPYSSPAFPPLIPQTSSSLFLPSLIDYSPSQQPSSSPPKPLPAVTYTGPPPPPRIPVSYYAPPPPPDLSTPPPTPTSTPTIPKAPGPPPMLINHTVHPTPSQSPPSSSNNISIGLIIGISIAVAGVFFIIALIIFCFCNRIRKNKYLYDHESPPPKDELYAALSKKYPSGSSEISCSPRGLNHQAFGYSTQNFTYEELVVATNGFSESNLVGEGGFGYVHKGILPSGREVAVKQLKLGSKQGEREFQAEVETISRVHHKHLVSLVGYCINGVKRLLVYEFVSNKTLDFHLHGTREAVMDWATRLKIAIGSAKGLAYLHEDCNPTIIHRDIKASNILLDSNFDAKVADFGLAKFFSDANHYISHVSTRVVGTIGYLAPEYAESGKTSYRSDVYSYGVILLELITGRPAIMKPDSSMSDSLVSWARPLLRKALQDKDYASLVDPSLEGNYKSKELSSMVACAANCVRHSSWRRPRMSQIIRALEGDISLEDFNEGNIPGQSLVSGYFDYDTNTFKEMSKFNMMMASRENRIKSSGDSSSG